MTAIKNSSALTADIGTDVIVAGKNPLRQAIADLLRYDGYFNQVFEFQPQSDVPLSALGAYIIADGAAAGLRIHERERNRKNESCNYRLSV